MDEFGGIEEATAWVAKKANLGEDYETQNYPTVKDKFESLMEKYMNTSYEARMKEELGPLYEWHKELQRILRRDHILCLMPVSDIQY